VIVSINQPAYLPWPGYFQRIAGADLHIVLDHVQFEKNSFINRNKVRTREGWAWLTVPVRTKGKFGKLPIDRIEIDNERNWSRKHWATLRHCYAHAPHFAEHAKFFDAVFARPWRLLADLMQEINHYLSGTAFGLKTPVRMSSAMLARGAKGDLILNLCKEAGATAYLSGPLGRDYLDQRVFEAAGIALQFDDSAVPSYPQAFPGFEPSMSAIDLLFNCGPESRYLIAPRLRGA